ncbi:hypothetical protein FXO37_29646 [Capsicum annuum]|nr:hypothetical protein FXO37_29646 [Capsicum annuum]
MLEILSDEVKQGNKSTNQFKANSFNRVLNAINEQLGMDCSSKLVENHLKTIRNTCSTIQTLLNKSGLGWDDNLKMITASPKVYTVHIQFGEVATTIGRMVDSRLDVIKLYEEVMEIEGYNEEFLGDAFDYLVQSDTLAKAFMVKNQNLRKLYLLEVQRNIKAISFENARKHQSMPIASALITGVLSRILVVLFPARAKSIFTDLEAVAELDGNEKSRPCGLGKEKEKGKQHREHMQEAKANDQIFKKTSDDVNEETKGQ